MSEKGHPTELTAEERKRLKDRFGINIQDDASLEEVVRQFDLTRQKIREIEQKARKSSGSGGEPEDEK